MVLLMKKTALVLALISALLFSVVGAHFIGLAETNPYWWWEPIPSETLPAKISILSPQNHATYSSGDVNITVNLTRPETPSTPVSGSLSASLFLDGIRIDSIPEYTHLYTKIIFNTVLHSLVDGNHKLEVKARYFLGAFSVDSTSTVFFTIENTSSSPSPSPSPEPTSSTYGEVNVQNTSQYLAVGGMVAFTITVVLVGLGLLLYRIKRK